jgi:hypothetical protein
VLPSFGDMDSTQASVVEVNAEDEEELAEIALFAIG